MSLRNTWTFQGCWTLKVRGSEPKIEQFLEVERIEFEILRYHSLAVRFLLRSYLYTSPDVARNPDEKSIMTYVSCFYHAFRNMNDRQPPPVVIQPPPQPRPQIQTPQPIPTRIVAPPPPERDWRKDVREWKECGVPRSAKCCLRSYHLDPSFVVIVRVQVQLSKSGRCHVRLVNIGVELTEVEK